MVVALNCKQEHYWKRTKCCSAPESFSSSRILCLWLYPWVKYKETKAKRTQLNEEESEDLLVVTVLLLRRKTM